MKIECEKIASDLSAYFDNELDDSAAVDVETHVKACAHCRGELEKMGKLRAALQATGREAVPEKKLIQDLMQALQRPERHDGRELFELGRGRPGPSFTGER